MEFEGTPERARGCIQMENKRMKKIAKTRFGVKQIILIVVTVVALIISGLNIGTAYHAPIPWSQSWNAISACTDSQTGSTVVLDNERTRISILDAQGRVSGLIEGTVGGVRLNPGMVIHTDGQYVYFVNATSVTGAGDIDKESIIQCDMQGNYVATLGVKKWADGRIHSAFSIMDFAFDVNGGLVAIAAEGNHIDYCTVNDEKELVVDQTVTIPSGTVYRCNLASNQDVLAVTTDSGDVYTYDGETLNKIYTYDGDHLFNYAVMGSDDVVYASDYNNDEIYALSGTDAPELAASEIKTSFMTPGNGNIIFSDEDTQSLQRMDLDTREITGSESAQFAPLFLMRSAVISLAYLWLIGFIIFWAVRELIRRRKRSKESAGDKVQSPFTRGRAIAFMFISATIVMSSFIAYYISDHKTQTMSNLAMAATVFADNFKENYVEDLAAINSPADTNGADYQTISEYLNSYWNINLSYNFDSYYFLTRVEDSDTMVVVADGNNQYQPGTRYVTMSDNDEGIALLKGETVQGSGRDSWGDYDYALAPLNDQNGTLVGVIEIGVYRQEFDRGLAQNIFTVILMVLTILMGAIVLMGEMFEIRTALARLADGDKVEHILALYRPFSFFFFLCTAIDYGYQTIILQDLMTANGLTEGTFLHPIILTAMAAGYLIGGPLGTWRASVIP